MDSHNISHGNARREIKITHTQKNVKQWTANTEQPIHQTIDFVCLLHILFRSYFIFLIFIRDLFCGSFVTSPFESCVLFHTNNNKEMIRMAVVLFSSCYNGNLYINFFFLLVWKGGGGVKSAADVKKGYY